MSTDRTYKIGINTQLIGKPVQPSGRLHTEGWQNLELTLGQFVEHIKLGHAFSAHFRESYRKTDNFVTTSVIAADIDGTMTIEEALGHEFIKNNAAFVYTTPSHTDDEHRFRIVFLLDQEITRSKDWANCLYGLALKLNGDLAIKDAARLFYGNPDAKIFEIGSTIPPSELDQLTAIGREQKAKHSKRHSVDKASRSEEMLGSDATVKTASGDVALVRDLESRTSVFCPFHIDRKHSAFIVRSRNGSSGIHCMSCGSTFWLETPDQYDFDAFERLVSEHQKRDHRDREEWSSSTDFFEQFFPPKPRVEVYEERFLPPLTYRPGITMVKSPKGSGKTEALKSLIQQIASGHIDLRTPKHDRPKSILLIGHRQSLIKEAARKLRLRCYIDNGEPSFPSIGYATSLDSLYKIFEPHEGYRSFGSKVPRRLDSYDVIILDESEQVFSHLMADTLSKNRGTLRAYNSLARAIISAKAVYALDADLGLITSHGLRALRTADWSDNCRIIWNKPISAATRRALKVYKSKKDMEALLLDAVRSGKRCFIVSNSKDIVDTIEQLIRSEIGSHVALRKITSDNSRNPEERDFVHNIVSEYLKIRVLLCSPSLGTGIDITFPNGERHVDEVFGFFYPFINTHTDIDQQLARVRNPGSISVWFSPKNFSYETNVDVIKDDLARGYWVESAIRGKDDDGNLIYDENHPLLIILSHIICYRRASQNGIVDLFKRLRESNGWDLEFVDKLASNKSMKSSWNSAKRAVSEIKIDGILSAKDLSDEDVIEVYEKRRSGEGTSKAELFELERGLLRMSLGVPIDRSIVEAHIKGGLIEKVRRCRFVFDELFLGSIGWTSEEAEVVGRIKKMGVDVLVVFALKECSLVEDGQLVLDRSVRKDDLARFAHFCRKNQTAIEEITKEPLRDDLEGNPVRQLNALLGHVGFKMAKGKRRRRDGALGFEYALDRASVDRMRSLWANFRDFQSSASRQRLKPKVAESPDFDGVGQPKVENVPLGLDRFL